MAYTGTRSVGNGSRVGNSFKGIGAGLLITLILELTAVCTVFAACKDLKKGDQKGTVEALNRKAVLDSDDATSAQAPTGSPTIQLPELMMTGPLDPIPAVDENGNETVHFILIMANLGNFASIDQLRKSPFYAQLCNLYPQLKTVKGLVDTGKGDLWFIRPWQENTSLAINEYTMEMFLGTQDEDEGKVLFRTEQAKPMLIRMSADDPGTVKINAVDNDGHSLTWIPTQQPQDNQLRTVDGIVNITYNPIDNSAEFGSDYQTTSSELSLTLRFYADRQVRIGNKLARYVAFHQEDGQIGLYIFGKGIETYAVIDGYAPDIQFGLTVIEGNDFGLGKNKTVVFKNLSALTED